MSRPGVPGGRFNHPFFWNGFVGVLTEFSQENIICESLTSQLFQDGIRYIHYYIWGGNIIASDARINLSDAGSILNKVKKG
jgi:hypothetical protein